MEINSCSLDKNGEFVVQHSFHWIHFLSLLALWYESQFCIRCVNDISIRRPKSFWDESLSINSFCIKCIEWFAVCAFLMKVFHFTFMSRKLIKEILIFSHWSRIDWLDVLRISMLTFWVDFALSAPSTLYSSFLNFWNLYPLYISFEQYLMLSLNVWNLKPRRKTRKS